VTAEPLGLALPFRIDGEGGVAVEAGVEKLRDNVVHILLTSLGERVMRRDYGAGLRQLVHDPVNNALLAVVEHQVIKAIAQAEPRVEVTAVRVSAHRHGSASVAEGVGTLGGELPGDAVIVEVEFTIRATRQPVSLSVPVGLGGV
jgi:phage baseplate assembly protein W